ncbi:hypothetical protein, partial [Treponema sp. R8-4-B8]
MAIKYISKQCCIPRSGPGALPHLKVRRVYSKWGFYLAPRCAALSIHTPSACMIERRGADGGINPASVYSSGVRCSAPGRFDLVHLHALGGVRLISPPPPPHPPPAPPH